MLWLVVALALLAEPAWASSQWAAVDAVLDQAVAAGAFPGAVAAVGNAQGLLYKRALGRFTYGQLPPRDPAGVPSVTLDTAWDMASCSKVMGATTAAARLAQLGLLDVQWPVTRVLGAAFAAQGKGAVSVVQLLTHSAGYPGDPSPGFWEASFGCPQSQLPHPAMDMSCTERIWVGLLNQTLASPPGTVYVYSDLSFITMQYVLGVLVFRHQLVAPADLLPQCAGLTVDQRPGAVYSCYFEAYVRATFGLLKMPHTGFLPPRAQWPALPPTRNDTWYRHAVSQGTVDDENCYANGGIAGHAGIFSTLSDIVTFVQAWLYGRRPDVLDAATRKLWTTEYNHSLSCRALGWSTNDPTVPDQGWGGTCGPLSTKTFLHIGYTGTQICADPEHGVYTVLLTNRVYPTGDNTQIQAVRRAWNAAVVAALGIAPNTTKQQE